MRLTDLKRRYIERLSEAVIFQIGEGYYETGRVVGLEYDEDAATVTATVPSITGDHKHYHVKIAEQNEEIKAECDCSYNGYPCKHMVAVMLEVAESSNRYVEKEKTAEDEIGSLKASVAGLAKEELVEMVMGCTRKYPDFKSKLMALFADEEQEAVKLSLEQEADEEKEPIDIIREQIKAAFADQGDSHSTSQIAERLKDIAGSMDTASDAMRVEAYWAVVDRVLKELNEYGISDGALEDIAIDHMRNVALLLKRSDELEQKRQEILEGLMEYYERDNCGIGDFIYETVHYLLKGKSDYQIVIDHIERMAESSPHSSYKRELLADLYKEIGDEEARLRTLESNLEYAIDYWRLAQYWIDKGEDDKAMEVAKEGIEKGKGAKEKLYLYIQEHYGHQDNYDAMLKSLESRVRGNKFRYYDFESDEIYKYLMDYHESTDDYEGKVTLLNLRLAYGNIDLEFYKEAKEILNEDDWRDFEKRFIVRIKKRGWIM